MPRIYTRRGDTGMTDTYDGQRVSKNHHTFAILGANDELTSRIGLAICYIHDKVMISQLRMIQAWLQNINSDIATWSDHQLVFPDDAPKNQLDEWISYRLITQPTKPTNLSGTLAKVIPVGGQSIAAAHLYLCQTACKNSEQLYSHNAKRQQNISRFMNRLGDYFVMAALHTERKECEKNYKWMAIAIAIVALINVICNFIMVCKP
jgi:cob(I)alamin adenosyltransferase